MTVAVAASAGTRSRIVGLVSAGHFYSHFCVLALPPLFPLLKAELDVSYAALGSVVAAFSAATAISQLPMGFLVDRIGGRRVLISGVTLIGVCLALVGFSTSYWQLLALFAIAGLGNSVFHPANYAILSARIEGGFFGRAVSIHTFSGYLGWTAAPPVMLGLVALYDWRWALTMVGIAGFALALTMAWQGRSMDGGTAGVRQEAASPPARGSLRRGFKLLRSVPMLMMFLFFLLTGAASTGIMAFSVVAVIALYGTDLVTANAALTGHLFASAVGVLLGGWIADWTSRHNLVTSTAIAGMALIIAVVGSGWLAVPLMIAAMALSGLLYGITSPSRDMLVRAATPTGSAGVAFGFTSTGLNIGSSLSPVLFGWVMDLGEPMLLFTIAGAMIALSTVTVVLTRLPAEASDPPPP